MLFTTKKEEKEISLDQLLQEMWRAIESGKRSDSVLIAADRRIIDVQRHDLDLISGKLDEIKKAQSSDQVYILSALAVGYANAMAIHGVIQERELKQLNALIGTIAERRLDQTEKLERKAVIKRILRLGKVAAHE